VLQRRGVEFVIESSADAKVQLLNVHTFSPRRVVVSSATDHVVPNNVPVINNHNYSESAI
jgi:hypothetical protein